MLSATKLAFASFVSAVQCALWMALLSGSAGARAQSPAPAFRVMTYNIHHGEGSDQKVDLQRIADVIKREAADIVALQEVDKGTERSARRDFPAELSRLTGLTCVFSNNYHYQGGEYGNAVLTRFPVVQATNTHFVKVNETEQRGILQLTLKVQGRELVFMATHLDYRADDAARWSNVGGIEALVRQSGDRPILLCGDFNDVPTSRVSQRLNETFRDTWVQAGKGDGFTIPADNPRKRIDYVWMSKGASLAPLRAWVPQSNASDHLPVVVEFRFGRR